MNEPVKLLDRSEAAVRLHVSPRTVRRYGAAGLLEEIQVGPKLKRVTAASVDRLLADGQRSARAGQAA